MEKGNKKLIIVRKNRNICVIAIATVISLLIIASFLIADNVMQYSLKSEAASISVKDNADVIGAENDCKQVVFSFTLDDVSESIVEEAKNLLDVKISYHDSHGDEQEALIESIEIVPKTDLSGNTSNETGSDHSDSSNSTVTDSDKGDLLESTTDSTTITTLDSSNDMVSTGNLAAHQEMSFLFGFFTSSFVESQNYSYDVAVTFTVPEYVSESDYEINYGDSVNKIGTVLIPDSKSGDVIEIPTPEIINITASGGVTARDRKTYFKNLELNIVTEAMTDDYHIEVSSSDCKVTAERKLETENEYLAAITIADGLTVGHFTVNIVKDALLVASFEFTDCADWISVAKNPQMRIDGVYSVSKNINGQVLIENEISDYIGKGSEIAVKFSVSADVESALLKNSSAEEDNTEIIQSDDFYYVLFYLNKAEKIIYDTIAINVKDIFGDNLLLESTLELKYDGLAPVIESVNLSVERSPQQIENITDKSNVTLVNGDKLIVELDITDNESGVAGSPNVELQCSDNENIKHDEESVSENTYTYKFSVDRDFNIYINQFIITDIKDNAGNIAENMIYSVQIEYNAAPTFIFENVAIPLFVKDGSEVTYKFRIQDEDNVNVTSIKINGVDTFDENNLSRNQTSDGVYEFEFTYQIPKGNYAHGNYIGITEIAYNDKVIEDMPYNEETIPINSAKWNVIYYEPIKKDAVKVSVNSVNGYEVGDIVTICNGGALKFTFANTKEDHPISIKLNSINYSIGDDTQAIEIPEGIDKDNWPLEVSYRISKNANYSDLHQLSGEVSYTVTDDAGNELTLTENVSNNIVYYAPLNVDNVLAVLIKNTGKSTNDNTDYARNDDVLNLICSMPNQSHKLTVSDFVITNLNCQVTINDEMTAKIDGADEKADEFFIKYKAVVTDEAGQKFETQELFSDITYLAPITVDNINFVSDNSFNNYAKLGSDLIFTAETNHDVEVSVVTISDGTNSSLASSNAYADGKLRFTFDGINGFANGSNILPEFILTDVAGNVWKSIDNQISSVRYDSERPKVSITPKFDGFFNENFSCVAVFNDSNLYVDGMSFTYVDEDTDITHSALNKDNFTEGEISFRQNLTLANEGTFRVSAAVKDKASNSYSNSGMVVTIDKTNPEITSIKISADSVQIFKKGFAVKDYIDISEKYVNEIICKLSDSSGTADWDINTPIDTEGKKTISIMATDMAGNACSYVFEVYIDATEPVPIVKDTLSDKELTSSDENTIVKEGKLYIALEEQQINETPDEITSLKLLDANGNLAYDFISEDGVLEYYEYEFTEYGEYALVLEAKDNAISADSDDGNTIGPITYKINFTRGTIWDTISENQSLYYTAISIVGIAVIVGIVFLVIFFKRKMQNQ